MPIKSIDLQYYHPEENSDKVYYLQIEKSGSGYVVNFQFGRRGSTLNTGTKTSSPVDLVKAEKIYNKVMAEKVGKGYQVNESSGQTEYADKSAPVKKGKSPEESKPVQPGTKRKILWTGSDTVSEKLIPQLLNPIDESEVAVYLEDDAYGIQPKMDGKHIMLRFEDGQLTAYNKKGIEVGYPKHWADALSVPCVLDGEAIGDVFHAFDCLRVMSQDLRLSGYETRYKRLAALSLGGSIKVVPLAVGDVAKKAMYEKFKAENKEGVVFKRLDAVYKPGKAHSDMCKFKFYSTASVIVLKHNLKNSIEMALLDGDGKIVPVGNVTLIGHAKPPESSVCEVRYLYMFKGGSLYQPTYLGPRDDVDKSECTFDQQRIKYKSEED